jgi:hypothetical protein
LFIGVIRAAIKIYARRGRLEMAKIIRSSFDRRSGIERRCISYSGHIPERRSGADRRVSGERRKYWIRTNKWSSTWKELYSTDWEEFAD